MGLSRNKVAVPEGAAGTPPFWRGGSQSCDFCYRHKKSKEADCKPEVRLKDTPRLPVLRTSVYHIGFMVQRQNARGHPAPGDIRFDSVGFAHGKYLEKQVKP